VPLTAPSRRRLLVSEIFGPTFQGEGPSLGRLCAFLRLGACNQHCVWCDTPYTWDWTGRNGVRYDPRVELTRMTDDAIVERLRSMDVRMLVVSGGEPMLQQAPLARLLGAAGLAGWRVEVETAGTVVPDPELVPLVSQFNVSPKLASSGNEEHVRCRPDAIRALHATGRAVWKFVVTSLDDLHEVDRLVERFCLRPVYVMPEGRDADTVDAGLRELAPAVLDRRWNLTTRLHVHIWGSRRGV
jgi:7-carboxy-7-deazaguanine synthase